MSAAEYITEAAAQSYVGAAFGFVVARAELYLWHLRRRNRNAQ